MVWMEPSKQNVCISNNYFGNEIQQQQLNSKTQQVSSNDGFLDYFYSKTYAIKYAAGSPQKTMSTVCKEI